MQASVTRGSPGKERRGWTCVQAAMLGAVRHLGIVMVLVGLQALLEPIAMPHSSVFGL